MAKRGRPFGYTPARHLLPALEATPDVTRGEQRLAAETALAQLRGENVPSFVSERAHRALQVLAAG